MTLAWMDSRDHFNRFTIRLLHRSSVALICVTTSKMMMSSIHVVRSLHVGNQNHGDAFQ